MAKIQLHTTSLRSSVEAFLHRKAGREDMREALAKLEKSEVFVIAFSKRFTSPVMGWPFPMIVEVESSSPGHVGGVQAWTGLQMDLEDAEALLRYASKKVQYCRVELLGGQVEKIGRTAADMVAAKGFHTPRPGAPKADIPTITVADVANWLADRAVLGRPEVELAVEIGFAHTHKTSVRGHNLLAVRVGEQVFILPDPDQPDSATNRAVASFWTTRYGRAERVEDLWPRSEMDWVVRGLPADAEVAHASLDFGKNWPARVIRTEYPGVVLLEGFWPRGRYMWFSTANFNIGSSGFYSHNSWFVEGKRREHLYHGYYSESLPGTTTPEGWEFARKLHAALAELAIPAPDPESPEYRRCGKAGWYVTGPQHWSDGTVDIGVALPEPVAEAVRQAGLTWHGAVAQKDWTDETIDQIVEIVRNNLWRIERRPIEIVINYGDLGDDLWVDPDLAKGQVEEFVLNPLRRAGIPFLVDENVEGSEMGTVITTFDRNPVISSHNWTDIADVWEQDPEMQGLSCIWIETGGDVDRAEELLTLAAVEKEG